MEGVSKRKKQMMKMAVILALMIFVSPLYALNSEMNRSTLRNLEGMMVLIEDLAPEIERGGLTKAQLQKNIEQKLRNEGIRPLTQEECFKAPGEPYLYISININPTKTDPEVYAYSIDIGLIQNVTLARDPSQNTYGVTWSTGGVGSIGKNNIHELADSVSSLVDLFVRAYLSVNPKN